MNKANTPQQDESQAADMPSEFHSRRVAVGGGHAAITLEELVQTHVSFVWRSLRRFGVPPGEVDDATQRVFLVANDKLESIRPGSERAFLVGVAMRVASHARRSKQRRDAAHQRFVDYQAARATPAGLARQTELRDTLDRILDRMPDELRSVFVLFELEELTITEIGELLALPRGTVATRLRRARMVFQDAATSLESRMLEARVQESGTRGGQK